MHRLSEKRKGCSGVSHRGVEGVQKFNVKVLGGENKCWIQARSWSTDLCAVEQDVRWAVSPIRVPSRFNNSFFCFLCTFANAIKHGTFLRFIHKCCFFIKTEPCFVDGLCLIFCDFKNNPVNTIRFQQKKAQINFYISLYVLWPFDSLFEFDSRSCLCLILLL